MLVQKTSHSGLEIVQVPEYHKVAEKQQL